MTQTLIITGAGASYSLSQKPIYHFTYGKLDYLPLGDDLVERIASYKTKSIWWLISALIHEEIFLESKKWQMAFQNLAINLEGFFEDFVLGQNFQIYLKGSLQKKAKDEEELQNIIKEKLEILQKNLEDKIALACKTNPYNHKKFAECKNFDKIDINDRKDFIKKVICFKLCELLFDKEISKNQENEIIDETVKQIFDIVGVIMNNVENLLKLLQTGITMIRGSDLVIEGNSIFNVKEKFWEDLLEKVQNTKDKDSYNIKNALESIESNLNLILELRGGHQANANISNFFGIYSPYESGLWENLINEEVRKKIKAFKTEIKDLRKDLDLEYSNQNNKNKVLAKILLAFTTHLPKIDRFETNLGYDCFNKISQEICKIRKEIFRTQISFLNPPSESYYLKNKNFLKSLKHLKGCFIAVSIVEYYRPNSIDYFMMNIEQMAPWEFWVDGKKLLKDDSNKRKEYIHKYTKFIIADILAPSSLNAVFMARYSNNYFKALNWRIFERALFVHKKSWDENSFSNYLLKNIKIITFNYEDSLERMFWEKSEINDNSKSFIKDSLKHIYGDISLKITIKKPNEEEEKKDCPGLIKDCLWKGLFSDLENENDIEIKLPESSDSDTTQSKFYIRNVFSQINESMKWIGQDDSEKYENDRKLYIDWLKDAEEIYILGFGFDQNNLYRIGIIDEFGNLQKEIFDERKSKKIFVSGSNAKITIYLRDLLQNANFESKITNISNKVSEIEFSKHKIILSENYLPQALIEDF